MDIAEAYSSLILALVFISGVWVGYTRFAFLKAEEGETFTMKAGAVARFAFLEFVAVVIMLVLFAIILSPNGMMVQYFIEYQAKFFCIPRDMAITVLLNDGTSVNYYNGSVVYKNNTTRLWPISAIQSNMSFMEESLKYSNLMGQQNRYEAELMKKWNTTK